MAHAPAVDHAAEVLPARPHTSRRPALLVAAAVFGATAAAAPLRDARADNISPTGKGITGGALLGAEVVTIVESLVGVHAGWAYGVGALVGAGGGGVGGYFVEKGSSDGRAPTYMLAGGLALVIPAIVLTLNATRYMPEEGATEDRAPTAPAAEPGVPGGSVSGAPTEVVAPPPSAPQSAPAQAPAPQPPPPSQPPPAGPQSNAPSPASGGAAREAANGLKMHRRAPPVVPALSLVDVKGGGFRLGVPVPDVRPVFSVAEQRQYGMRQESELRLPVLHVVF